MGLTCSAVILTTITLRNVGDMKMRRAHLHAPAGARVKVIDHCAVQIPHEAVGTAFVSRNGTAFSLAKLYEALMAGPERAYSCGRSQVEAQAKINHRAQPPVRLRCLSSFEDGF
jgi:hypothetical protein